MLKSVRVYFNTKRMSAILKALQNRKIEVELKSEVIEFGLIDDFNNKLSGLKNMQKALSKSYSKGNKVWAEAIRIEQDKADAYNELSQDTSDSTDVINELTREFDKVVKAAKELGIDPKSIKGLNESIKIVESMEDDINQANQILPDLKK